jgi:uncharacterized Zn-binding protein involved in type VI secretion
MNIIGWIRVGDKAACGGVVLEGCPTDTSHGLPYSYQGAKMVCRKKCVIAGAYPTSTLMNGKKQVLHGMLTTGLCPLISTLNGIDGVENQSASPVESAFVPDTKGAWVGGSAPRQKEEIFDEQLMLVDPKGQPLSDIHHSLKSESGEEKAQSDSDGTTTRVTTQASEPLKFNVNWVDFDGQ